MVPKRSAPLRQVHCWCLIATYRLLSQARIRLGEPGNVGSANHKQSKQPFSGTSIDLLERERHYV